GKWTTYRKMAEATVDLAIKTGELRELKCRTKDLAIHGSSGKGHQADWGYHGCDYPLIQQLIEQNPDLGEALVSGYPFTAAEVVWAARHEMIEKVEDFLARRCRLLLLDAKASVQAAPKVAEIMAAELNKSPEWVQNEIKQYTELANRYML